jgi:microcystin-dependent protein
MTTTTNKFFVEPVTGTTPGGAGGWGDQLNTINTQIDSCLGSTSTISATSNYSLSTTDIQSMRLLLNGTLSSNINISIPSGVQGSWIIANYTADSSAAVPCYVSIETTAGGSNSVDAPRGSTISVYSDGTTIYLIGNSVPAGQIISWGGIAAPSGYLLCDGTAISRSTYSALYRSIGTTWGVGDGVTTFNLPNLANMFLRGAGSSVVGTYEADIFGSHTHTDSGHIHYSQPGTDFMSNTPGVGVYASGSFGTTTNTVATSYANLQNSGGSETRPKNYRVLYCVKT